MFGKTAASGVKTLSCSHIMLLTSLRSFHTSTCSLLTTHVTKGESSTGGSPDERKGEESTGRIGDDLVSPKMRKMSRNLCEGNRASLAEGITLGEALHLGRALHWVGHYTG